MRIQAEFDHERSEMFFAESGGFLPLDEIRGRVAERGVRPDRPVIAYCNGGVAATVFSREAYVPDCCRPERSVVIPPSIDAFA